MSLWRQASVLQNRCLQAFTDPVDDGANAPQVAVSEMITKGRKP